MAGSLGYNDSRKTERALHEKQYIIFQTAGAMAQEFMAQRFRKRKRMCGDQCSGGAIQNETVVLQHFKGKFFQNRY